MILLFFLRNDLFSSIGPSPLDWICETKEAEEEGKLFFFSTCPYCLSAWPISMELAKNNFLCFYVFVFVFTVIYSNILVLSNFKKKMF